ncbi:hypothetical protein [Pseudonocardia sp. TRM90224]|uniref:hypothetical protein n=1 Tax=Pseudonocardia sp. TRM90224 TaxID=2812678 RepID=UPI001E63287C|nr:hypothetical protein [Pseudonocardia sp. TRM90224]
MTATPKSEPVSEPEQTTVITPTRRTVVAEQRRHHGGIKWGAAFFGWLAATGTAVLLTAIAAMIGTATGITLTPGTLTAYGVTTAIVLLAVLFVAYYAGGYVAGRMARFDGFKQGLGVWLWSLLIAAALTAFGLATGPRFADFTAPIAGLDGLPPLPTTPEMLSTSGVLAALIALAAALVGAVLGGLAGMHYHRRIDRTGLDS